MSNPFNPDRTAEFALRAEAAKRLKAQEAANDKSAGSGVGAVGGGILGAILGGPQGALMGAKLGASVGGSLASGDVTGAATSAMGFGDIEDPEASKEPEAEADEFLQGDTPSKPTQDYTLLARYLRSGAGRTA